jgi:hypothetical protein
MMLLLGAAFLLLGLGRRVLSFYALCFHQRTLSQGLNRLFEKRLRKLGRLAGARWEQRWWRDGMLSIGAGGH